MWRIHIDNKTVARVESKREENPIGAGIENQPKGESRASIELVGLFATFLFRSFIRQQDSLQESLQKDTDYEE